MAEEKQFILLNIENDDYQAPSNLFIIVSDSNFQNNKNLAIGMLDIDDKNVFYVPTYLHTFQKNNTYLQYH